LQAGALVVSVQDFGVGMSTEFMGRLFQKFEHAQDALTRDTQGCGLGLAICKLVVEAHGGRIWAESDEGRGSTFYFSLPLEAAAKRTILVVDHDDDLHKSIADYCERRGFRLLPCHNARDVVRLVRSYHPQVVALDTLEPAGTSAEICGRLAADPVTQAIPVICFVGPHETKNHGHGANLHLLAKPLDLDAFGGLLERVFANAGGAGA
jgi:CheY-like chemotaxis protein